MARLLANLPLLCAGHLRLVIEVRERQRYLETLAAYRLAGPFEDFCAAAYAATRALVAAARAQQAARRSAP